MFCGGTLSRTAAFLFCSKTARGRAFAAMVMIVVMLPCFLFAMYEKHGQPLEVVVKNIIHTRGLPAQRSDHTKPRTITLFWSVNET